MKLKATVFRIIDEHQVNTKIGRAFNWFIIGLILLNSLAIILDSFQSIHTKYGQSLYIFEVFSVVIFTIEYLLRLWVSDLRYPSKPKWSARLRYMISFDAIIDLLAILPFYLPLIIPFDLRCLRMLRILRVTRLLKLSRYAESMRLIGIVFKEKRSELAVILFLTIILLIVSSTLVYFMEYPVQPQAFPNIAESLWWAVVTLTTVGYGDIVPMTGLGKIISSLIAFLGIGLVALPTGILGGAFIRKIRDSDGESEIHHCPNCGHEL